MVPNREMTVCLRKDLPNCEVQKQLILDFSFREALTKPMAQVSYTFEFCDESISRPISKIVFAFFGPGPMRGVCLHFQLPYVLK
jgi:hypothetical protein